MVNTSQLVKSIKIKVFRVEGKICTNLMAQALGSYNGNFIANPLVGLEIKGELGIVPLNDNLRGLLYCLNKIQLLVSSNAEKYSGRDSPTFVRTRPIFAVGWLSEN